jgi:hypothetical protein
MGLSQTQFASQVLKGARVTLAQYESSKVPQNKFLEKLEAIARQAKERCQQSKDPAKYLRFRMLQQVFHFLRFAELKERAGVDYKFFPATEEHDAGGFAFLRVRGEDEMMSIMALLALWDALDEKATREKAKAALDQLIETVAAIAPERVANDRKMVESLSVIPQLTITRKPKTS